MIWSGFVIGLFGSLHCVGMCGPLALAVPTIAGQRILSVLLFQGGRILVYGLLGLFFGILGLGVQMAGFQSLLSILTGVFILLIAIFPSVQHHISGKLSWNIGAWVRKRMSQRLKKKNVLSLLALGGLNGLLPCGLIYVALAGAMETGYVESAMAYMLMFGVGTSVLLALTMFSRPFLASFTLRKSGKLIPYLTAILGAMFLIRGLVYMVPPEHQHLATVEFLQTITFCHGR
ncbi:MAG: sulfite exporter TauE/SafE family protein [Cyclobacteriaceae bacterium]|nr:sulfite exporter TauE/SafE family protein [Cyclobacteriaceae bacterium]